MSPGAHERRTLSAVSAPDTGGLRRPVGRGAIPSMSFASIASEDMGA